MTHIICTPINLININNSKLVLYDFHIKTMYGLVCLIFMLCVFIYVYWCSTRFPYQMMFVSFNSNTPGATSGTGTTYPSGAPELTPGFIWGVCVAQSVVFCVVLFFRSLLSFCPFYFGHCLLFIDLRLLVTPLVPSNFS